MWFLTKIAQCEHINKQQHKNYFGIKVLKLYQCRFQHICQHFNIKLPETSMRKAFIT